MLLINNSTISTIDRVLGSTALTLVVLIAPRKNGFASGQLMLGILMYETLPGSLGPQTLQKNGATSLQSSNFG